MGNLQKDLNCDFQSQIIPCTKVQGGSNRKIFGTELYNLKSRRSAFSYPLMVIYFAS
jgi:hypothetical protein